MLKLGRITRLRDILKPVEVFPNPLRFDSVSRPCRIFNCSVEVQQRCGMKE